MTPCSLEKICINLLSHYMKQKLRLNSFPYYDLYLSKTYEIGVGRGFILPFPFLNDLLYVGHCKQKIFYFKLIRRSFTMLSMLKICIF